MQLSFIGAGKMATAIACGLVNENVLQKSELAASDVSAEARRAFSDACGCDCTEDNSALVCNADVLVLAVKPQVAAEVLQPLHGLFDGKLVISIAAGLKLAKLIEWTGTDRVIRVMPNTPAMVTRGASVFSCAQGVTDSDRDLAQTIFSAIGYTCEMPEDKLDAVTALSGSGPAFLFAYVEAMVDGATKLGLDPDQAEMLCVQTIAGAAEMLKRKLGTPEDLRKAVTSKGGTTAAGLASLQQDDFHQTLVRCLQAATARSIELGS